MRYWLLFVVCFFSASLVMASSNDATTGGVLDVVNEKDLWAVRDWLKQKRMHEGSKKLSDVIVSGEVRIQWQNIKERLSRIKQVGSDSVSGLSNNLFDAEVNLYFDYKADKTWAAIKLEFDNAMGRETGQVNQISLERAYMGYHIFRDSRNLVDIMVGRQRLYDLYDSEVQYNSTADGFTVVYGLAFPKYFDFTLKGGGYIADATQSHAFWLIEAGLYDIMDLGIYFEYSFIDWAKSGSTYYNNPNWKFINHQFVLGYVFNPEITRVPARFFGGILFNADADSKRIQQLTNGKVSSKENLAWYVAIQLGKLENANDWAFQAQWQGVEAQSMPDFDVSGIGRGNSVGSSLYTSNSNGLANGNTNYNGWEVDFMYNITAELVLEVRFQRALSQNSDIGLPLNYTNYQVEMIYGF